MKVQVEARSWAVAWKRVRETLGSKVLWQKIGERTIVAEVDPGDLAKLKMTPGIDVLPEVDRPCPPLGGLRRRP